MAARRQIQIERQKRREAEEVEEEEVVMERITCLLYFPLL